MRTSLTPVHLLPAMLLLLASTALAQPGTTLPAASELSAQKNGSVLIYNFYSSSILSPGAENTRLNVTNTGTVTVFIHFFFVDGSTGSPADFYVCLTPNQTTTFNTSDTDPGVRGYAVRLRSMRRAVRSTTTF